MSAWIVKSLHKTFAISLIPTGAEVLSIKLSGVFQEALFLTARIRFAPATAAGSSRSAAQGVRGSAAGLQAYGAVPGDAASMYRAAQRGRRPNHA
jgi:hypothetical protein